jgi:hypothetical protein
MIKNIKSKIYLIYTFMIRRYNDFLNECILIQLLNESKIVFSNKFNNILSKMREDRLALELLKISGNDIDTRYNYIDITDQKDSVSFIMDAKAQEFRSKKVETYRVINNGRYLTHSDKNDRIFALLGYDKNDRQNWAPEVDTIGVVLKEAQSPVSTNKYVLFEEYGTDSPRLAVINSAAIKPYEVEPKEVWTSSRNPMKIGRLVRAILQSAKITFTDKDIEDFTNKWKATYDFAADALKQFDVVKGGDIAKWYDSTNYKRGGGTLNNSCMAKMDSETFNIYTENTQVSLVILYDDEGKLTDGKYTSDKIKGRALLWDAFLNGNEIQFMDRIYTTHDSDVELFKQFAEKNNWWWKRDQTMDTGTPLTNGSNVVSDPSLRVEIDEGDCEFYPYLDTMCYLNDYDAWLYNYPKGTGKYLKETGGGYDTY